MSQAKSTGRRGALRFPDDFNNKNACPPLWVLLAYRPACRAMRTNPEDCLRSESAHQTSRKERVRVIQPFIQENLIGRCLFAQSR
jgi:hypothetical protein